MNLKMVLKIITTKKSDANCVQITPLQKKLTGLSPPLVLTYPMVTQMRLIPTSLGQWL